LLHTSQPSGASKDEKWNILTANELKGVKKKAIQDLLITF